MLVIVLIVGLLATILTLRIVHIRREEARHWGSLDSAGVERGLALLLKRGYDGGFAVFLDRPSSRFVQFRKYINVDGSIGLEMHFPRTKWSEEYYSSVQSVLKERGIRFERTSVQSSPTVEFVRVDFGKDVRLATIVVADIATKVFARPEVRLQLKVEDVCPLDELVTSKDHPKPLQLLAHRFSRD
jgi:hypothetical protein